MQPNPYFNTEAPVIMLHHSFLSNSIENINVIIAADSLEQNKYTSYVLWKYDNTGYKFYSMLEIT